MLQNLEPLKEAAKSLVQNNIEKDLIFTPASREEIATAYRARFTNWSAVVTDSVLKINNPSGQSAYLPFQWFSRIHHCRNVVEALNEYVPYVERLKEHISDATLRDLPRIDWMTELSPQNVQKIYDFITSTFSSQQEQKCFEEFLDGRCWLEQKGSTEYLTGKKLNRTSSDYIASAVTSLTRLINDSAGKIDQFIDIYTSSLPVRNLISSLHSSSPIAPSSVTAVGTNIIFYGAPGTGKSHTIEELVVDDRAFRTVFHADTQNSDFVGCLKPSMNGDDVSYSFRPGPFTNALIAAANRSGEHFWLAIEEINRAPAAAVFGEIFQLLDRKPDTRESVYGITLSDPDMLKHIKDNAPAFLDGDKLKIPGNLSLLATMNSSDQAVMPLDTAFKRRWKFKYIPLAFDVKCAAGDLTIPSKDGTESTISWKNFALHVNALLTEQSVPEDKHLGPFFLSEDELKGKDSQKEALTGKLFVYLWDDVLRHIDSAGLFSEKIRTYGDLNRSYNQSQPVFSDSFYNSIESDLTPVNPEPTPSESEQSEVDGSVAGAAEDTLDAAE